MEKFYIAIVQYPNQELYVDILLWIRLQTLFSSYHFLSFIHVRVCVYVCRFTSPPPQSRYRTVPSSQNNSPYFLFIFTPSLHFPPHLFSNSLVLWGSLFIWTKLSSNSSLYLNLSERPTSIQLQLLYVLSTVPLEDIAVLVMWTWIAQMVDLNKVRTKILQVLHKS